MNKFKRTSPGPLVASGKDLTRAACSIGDGDGDGDRNGDEDGDGDNVAQYEGARAGGGAKEKIEQQRRRPPVILEENGILPQKTMGQAPVVGCVLGCTAPIASIYYALLYDKPFWCSP